MEAAVAVESGDRADPVGGIPAEGSPVEVSGWWRDLSAEERESVIAAEPATVGALDGVPTVDRDRANRLLFDVEYADITAQQQDDPDEDRGAVIRAMDAIKRYIDSDATRARPRAFLVGFSREGRGRAIIATGDPDTADNVVTNVQGTGTSLKAVRSEIDKSDAIVDRLGQLSRRTNTSTITWLGYDAPQDLLESASKDRAVVGGESLRSFQDGLRATRDGERSYNSVIGYSYGSTVIGHAASEALLDVDAVVFVGSPGVGVDHVSELQLPEDCRVFATTAQNDVIRLTPDFAHGPQPIDEDFGATVFDSDPGADGEWFTVGLSTEAHSQYWNTDSDSLRNFAAIILGRGPL
ncbi:MULTISPECIES: alpha/beta hydrolase family protein [Prauserella salsuginis group]|uniref:Alpha/beta hydrolase family protein n=1 Tax=Prauserella salsuginis TaxID=387889 RepID=A0ABW6FYH4_9PSEU|nr:MULTISPECIES: alpha/beta hydrolase family protein [Prauserella salsuginis group]